MLQTTNMDSTEYLVLSVIVELVHDVQIDIAAIPKILDAQDLMSIWEKDGLPSDLIYLDRMALAETLQKLPRPYVQLISDYIIGRIALTVLRTVHGKDAPMPDTIRVLLPEAPIDPDNHEFDY